MKIRHPGASRALSSRRAISCASSSSSSSRRTRSRSSAAASSSRLAWPRTISTGRRAWSWLHAARPDGDQLRRGGVDRFLALANLVAKPRFGLVQRQAGKARVDEIADLRQRRGGGAAVERDDAVLDPPVGADQHCQRAGIAQGHEAQLPEPQFVFRREHHAGRLATGPRAPPRPPPAHPRSAGRGRSAVRSRADRAGRAPPPA